MSLETIASARIEPRSRISRLAARTIGDENKEFIIVNLELQGFADDLGARWSRQCLFAAMHAACCEADSPGNGFTKGLGKGDSAPTGRRPAIRHVETVLAPQRECGTPKTSNQPIPGAA
jgi:hypothetical protein